jgi:hypothetical protein
MMVMAGCLSGCSLQDFDALGSEAVGTSGRAGAGTAGNDNTGGGSGGTSNEGGSGGSLSVPGAGNGGGGGVAGNNNGGSGNAGGSGDRGGTGGSDVTPGDAGVLVNLLSDPGFEGGHEGWVPFGDNPDILDVEGQGRDGSRCIFVTNRTATYSGAGSPVLQSLLEPGRRYRAEAWVRMEDDADTVGITLKAVCTEEAAPTYTQLTTAAATSTDWTFLSGQFTVASAATCTLTELLFYIEGPDPINAFYVDDVGLYFVQ